MSTSFSSPMSASSPLVDKVMSRKHRLLVSQNKWRWGLANVVAALILCLEANVGPFHVFADASSVWRSTISRLETFLMVVFLTNGAVDFYGHFFPFSASIDSASDVVLSPKQMKLFGVSPEDPGFRLKSSSKSADKAVAGHPYGFSPPLDGSFIAGQLPMSGGVSYKTMYGSAIDSTSFVHHHGSFHQQPPHETSPPTATSHARRESLRPKASLDGTLTDEKALQDYIKDFEAKEKGRDGHNASSGDLEMWPNSPPKSTSSKTSTVVDYSPVLKQMAYQLSTPTPFATDLTQNKPTLSTSSMPASAVSNHRLLGDNSPSEALCRRIGVDPGDLVDWMQNIRIWISETIIGRVIKQIDELNGRLVRAGLGDSLVGKVGPERLRKCAVYVEPEADKLARLTAFLDITVHQDYLVHRLRELGRGGAMSAYKWDGGSDHFNGVAWSDKFPTDAELVMGCFAAYMDTRMPANYRTTSMNGTSNVSGDVATSTSVVEDRPFTGVYFVRMPRPVQNGATAKAHERQVSTTASNATHSLVILQTSQKPPHFVLQMGGDERLEISPGRHNLFHTLLFFLHHFKARDNGMLDRLNLGPSGVNILWVVR